MRTASYFTFDGPGRIGISVGQPRRIAIDFPFYSKLSPSRSMLKLDYEAYRSKYFSEILGPLDPQSVVSELHEIAGNDEPVLLCFERPPFTASNWCHRRMVAEWIEERIGIQVPEVENDPQSGFFD